MFYDSDNVLLRPWAIKWHSNDKKQRAARFDVVISSPSSLVIIIYTLCNTHSMYYIEMNFNLSELSEYFKPIRAKFMVYWPLFLKSRVKLEIFRVDFTWIFRTRNSRFSKHSTWKWKIKKSANQRKELFWTNQRALREITLEKSILSNLIVILTLEINPSFSFSDYLRSSQS